MDSRDGKKGTRSVAAVMRKALAVYLNKEASTSEMEKKYLALEKRLAYLESKVIEKS